MSRRHRVARRALFYKWLDTCPRRFIRTGPFYQLTKQGNCRKAKGGQPHLIQKEQPFKRQGGEHVNKERCVRRDKAKHKRFIGNRQRFDKLGLRFQFFRRSFVEASIFCVIHGPFFIANPERDLYRFRLPPCNRNRYYQKARPPLGDEAVLRGAAAGEAATAYGAYYIVACVKDARRIAYALFAAFAAAITFSASSRGTSS